MFSKNSKKNDWICSHYTKNEQLLDKLPIYQTEIVNSVKETKQAEENISLHVEP